MGSRIRLALLPRQVHCYVRPAPTNLAQSQLVLQELNKFGEVSTFFNLRYDFRQNVKRRAGSMMVIFESDDSATKAIDASPLIIPLPSTTPQKQEREQSTDTSASNETSESGESPESDGPDAMICTVRHSEHDHEVTARENPYHRSFLPSIRWLEVQDLMHTNNRKTDAVPHVAYADCFASRKRARPYRVLEELSMQNEEHGDNSLFGLWEKGKKARSEWKEKEKDQ